MKPLRDHDAMPFGKHKRKKMQDVPPGYLDWMRGQLDKEIMLNGQRAVVDERRQVLDYIVANWNYIQKELDREDYDPEPFA